MRISSIPYFDNPFYLYNGKELDMMSGLNSYNYGARQYYSVEPAWDRVDPLAEKYYNSSPYSYCYSNSVNFVDPLGVDTLSDEQLAIIVGNPVLRELITSFAQNAEKVNVGSYYDIGTSTQAGVSAEYSHAEGMVVFLGGDDAGYHPFIGFRFNGDDVDHSAFNGTYGYGKLSVGVTFGGGNTQIKGQVGPKQPISTLIAVGGIR